MIETILQYGSCDRHLGVHIAEPILDHSGIDSLLKRKIIKLQRRLAATFEERALLASSSNTIASLRSPCHLLQLPNSLLIQIFLDYVGQEPRTKFTAFGAVEAPFDYLTLISCACLDIIVDYPLFHRNIYIRDLNNLNSEKLKSVLILSIDTPLDVTISTSHIGWISADVMKALKDTSHRLRSFNFQGETSRLHLMIEP